MELTEKQIEALLLAKRPNYAPWIAVAVLGALLAFSKFTPAPAPGPNPAPGPVPTVVDTAAIAKIAKGGNSQAAAKYGSLLAAMAEILERNASTLDISTDQWRAWQNNADTLTIRGTNLAGTLPGIGDAVNAACVQAVGLDDRKLSAADLLKLSLTLQACAKALGVSP